MAIHVATIALVQIDSQTGLPFTKDTSPMNKYLTQQTPSNTRARSFSTEQRVIPDATNTNTANYPTTSAYLALEDLSGYNLVHIDQTYIITQTPTSIADIDPADIGDILSDGSVPFAADESMGNHKLTNVTDPTNPQDAATKAYVDAHSSVDIGARTTRSTNQTISASTFTDVSFNTNVYAVGVTFTSGINPLKILTAGKYQINWGLVFANDSSGGTARQAQIVLNGATIIDFSNHIDAAFPAGFVYAVKGATEFLLGVNDTIGMQAFSSVTTDVVGGFNYSPFITVRKVA
jgi:hypothetical protein